MKFIKNFNKKVAVSIFIMCLFVINVNEVNASTEEICESNKAQINDVSSYNSVCIYQNSTGDEYLSLYINESNTLIYPSDYSDNGLISTEKAQEVSHKNILGKKNEYYDNYHP